MQDKTTLGISVTFREYIEALAEEVVINGEPFEAQKKWLRKNSENEGVNYAALERNLTDFFVSMEDWKVLKSTSSQIAAKLLARDCYLDEGKVDDFVSAINKAREKEEAERISAEKKAEEEHIAQEKAELEAAEVNGLDVDADGNVFCTDKNIQGKLSIPTSLKGKRVNGIKEKAFEYCLSLTSIVIPNSVTKIGERAFGYCTGLTSVVIPNSVTKIGERAFGYCTGLTSVVIPNSVTKIGWGAFEDCKGLASIVIGNSVREISWRAFEGCKSLTSVVIPNSVAEIGDDAFRDCVNLESAKLPRRFKGRLFPLRTKVEYY